MPRRLKPIVLLSLITAIVLSLALFAGANQGGAVGTALGQVGKPYALGTDGLAPLAAPAWCALP